MAEDRDESRFQSSISLVRDVFSLLRDGALFVGFVLLVFFPATINGILGRAHITSINGGVFTWQLANANQQLQVAQNTIATLQASTQALNAQTSPGTLKAATPAQQQAITVAKTKAQVAASEAMQVQQTLQATIRTNAALLAQAEAGSALTPPKGYCYQEMDPAKSDAQRYGMMCHATLQNCDKARGPNPRTAQSGCVAVILSGAAWAPASGGYLGSWYQFSPAPFGAPFPALPSR